MNRIDKVLEESRMSQQNVGEVTQYDPELERKVLSDTGYLNKVKQYLQTKTGLQVKRMGQNKNWPVFFLGTPQADLFQLDLNLINNKVAVGGIKQIYIQAWGGAPTDLQNGIPQPDLKNLK